MNWPIQIAAGALLATIAASSSSADEWIGDILNRGLKLSAQEAAQRSQAISQDPDELNLRIELLAYYSRNSLEQPEAMRRHQELVLWLIEHHPESEVHAFPQAHIFATNVEGTIKVKDCWLEQIRVHATDAPVLARAAQYFLPSDFDFAVELLWRADKVDPESTEWVLEIARLYQHKSWRAWGDQRLTLARQAFDAYEQARQRMDEKELSYNLGEVAKAAYDVFEDGKAERYAKRLLDINKNRKPDWGASGNCVHNANLVLGRVALRAGDVEQAKTHLLKAGAITGSSTLSSFGPNMALARDLLEHGERDVVLQYFELCKKFWDRPKLQEWAAEINNGRIPDFGANLVY
jgi:tetratricopeptide (TPR) repeat protein